MSGQKDRVVMLPFRMFDPTGGARPQDAAVEIEVHAIIAHMRKRARRRDLHIETMIIALMEATARSFGAPSLLVAAMDKTLGRVGDDVPAAAREFAKVFEARLVQVCADDAPWATQA